jgi:hypothetical protein
MTDSVITWPLWLQGNAQMQKVKFALRQAVKTHRGSRGIALLVL